MSHSLLRSTSHVLHLAGQWSSYCSALFMSKIRAACSLRPARMQCRSLEIAHGQKFYKENPRFDYSNYIIIEIIEKIS